MTTTLEIAARLVPLHRSDREALLGRIPRGRGYVSQLADSFGGTWYLHRGDLAIDGDFSSTRNLVVDGDLTVRGTLWDHDEEALLVVTGDLCCRNLFSRQLLVVLGSLRSSGVVYAEYNDWCFEVWGDELRARALLLDDKSALLPDRRHVDLEYESDLREVRGDVRAVLSEPLLRYSDAAGNLWRRENGEGGARWVDDGGETLEGSEGPAIEHVVPEDYDRFFEAVSHGRPVFRAEAPATGSADAWRLDPEADAALLSEKAASEDPRERAAAASHPRTPTDVLQRLVEDERSGVRAAAAHRRDLPAAAAAALAADGDEDVRRQLAAGPHAVPHLAALARDASPEVRRATASHPALDDEQRRRLLLDPDEAVRRRALRYLPVTAAWVEELRGSADGLLSAWALEHGGEVAGEPALDTDWRAGLLDERQAVREAALRAARDPRVLAFLDERRGAFRDDPSAAVRRALATAARDPETLAALAVDADEYVRRFALANLAVPEAVLLAAAGKLAAVFGGGAPPPAPPGARGVGSSVAAAAPRQAWGTGHPGYMELMSLFQDLYKHPRLPAEALRRMHRAFPMAYRLEPHRNMPLDVALERAESLEPSLAFDATLRGWKEAVGDAAASGMAAAFGECRPSGSADPDATAGVLAEMLSWGNRYLEGVARMNGAVPVEALLAHARSLGDDRYALEDVAANAVLGGEGPRAEELRRLLFDTREHGVDRALASNPDLPVRSLRELRERAPEEARRTLWQVHGEVV